MEKPTAPTSLSLIAFSNEQRNKILGICNMLAVLTAALAFFFAPLLYNMSGQKLILYPGLAEGCLFLLVPVLSYFKKKDAAILLTFILQIASVTYFGILLGPVAPIWGMGLFLGGIALLIFEKDKIKILTIAFVAISITAIQLNNSYQFVTSIPLGKVYQGLLSSMVIFTVLLLNSVMLYFYNKQIKNDQKIKADYIHALEDAKASLRHYVREISHEISGPLNIISGIGQNYLRDKEEPRRNMLVDYEHLQAIHLAATSILELASNDLEWAKLEAGEVSQVALAPFDLNAWLDETNMLYRQLAKNRDIQLIMILTDVIPGYVISDKSKLTRILRNLLTNAIKFSSPKGTVTLTVSLVNNQLTLAVSDKGKGLTPEEQLNIFKPFVSSKTEFMNGTGLGLPILQKNVIELNGTVAVDSIKDKGSTFTVTIPVEVASQLQAIEKIVESDVCRFDNLQCLVVDDNEMNRIIADMHLKRLNITSFHATSGAAAIDIARQRLPDFILLDIYMPGCTAFDVLEWLKKDKTLSLIPVIVISGEKLKDTRDAVMKAGANGFVHSPVKFEHLYAALSKLVKEGVIARE
jgi:signal transduction histidine kinase/ActR/RegA family two-component response regulator